MKDGLGAAMEKVGGEHCREKENPIQSLEAGRAALGSRKEVKVTEMKWESGSAQIDQSGDAEGPCKCTVPPKDWGLEASRSCLLRPGPRG